MKIPICSVCGAQAKTEKRFMMSSHMTSSSGYRTSCYNALGCEDSRKMTTLGFGETMKESRQDFVAKQGGEA
jgi:hypothetical protein